MSCQACGILVASFDQASGTSIDFAIGAIRPARTSTSKTLSSAAESDDPGQHDRLDVLGELAEVVRAHPDLVALQPVQVALQRVDLAVVRQHPERLRQPPAREGVGRIALVVDREGADEARVLQVGVEDADLLGQHHPLVDDRPAAHRADVEVADPGPRLLDPPPDHVELALEGLLVDALGVRDQDLLDLRPRRVGLLRRGTEMSTGTCRQP